MEMPSKLERLASTVILALAIGVPHTGCKKEVGEIEKDTRDRVGSAISSAEIFERRKDWYSAASLYRHTGNEAKAREYFEIAALEFEQQHNWYFAALAYQNAGNEAKAMECKRKNARK